jgi:hypothetical protein
MVFSRLLRMRLLQTSQALAWGDEVASQVHMRHATIMCQSPAKGQHRQRLQQL